MGRKRSWVVALVLGGLFGAALYLSAGEDATAGKTVYDKKCAMCHGKAGEGNPGMAKMLKVELHPLGSKPTQARSDADWRKIIAEGSGKMKAVAGLSEAQVADVIAYCRTLAQK